jgi:hypothetical protein
LVETFSRSGDFHLMHYSSNMQDIICLGNNVHMVSST